MTEAGHRIFIAVPLDPALRQAIEAVERDLEAAGVVLNWIKSVNLHFTLRFLGQISQAELLRARRATREAADGVAPFAIRLEGLGAFPTAQRPKVLWVGVGQGAEQLTALAGRLDDALARARFAKEPRSFQAHLTIARIRAPGRPPSLEPAITSLAGVRVGEQGVRSVVVVESHLRPSGAFYVPVEEVPLSGYEK